MHLKRVIPCLDVDAGRVVKGVEFLDIRDAGDPVELAAHYDREGADELVFLDITATHEKRETIVELARRTADEVFVPFTIGGGIRSVEDAQAVLDAGADKVSINSAALQRPELIDELAMRVRRAVRGAGDRRQGAHRPIRGPIGDRSVPIDGDADARWEAYLAGGRTPTGRDVVEWAREAVERGAGEILLTSMDRDGTNDGYDLALTTAVSEAVGVPVIASGGAGELEHLAQALQAGADAALCASIFHYGQYTIPEAKAHLAPPASRALSDSRRERDMRSAGARARAAAALPGGSGCSRLAAARNVALVGGAVRDLLLGRTPRELDVVSVGRARLLCCSRLAALGTPRVDEHERFGTALVELDGGRIDVADRAARALPGARGAAGGRRGHARAGPAAPRLHRQRDRRSLG